MKQGGAGCSCNVEGVVNLSIIGRRQVSFKPGSYLPIRCREPLFYDQLDLTIVFNVFYYAQIIFLQPTQIASDRGGSSLHPFLFGRCRGETSRQLPEKNPLFSPPDFNQTTNTPNTPPLFHLSSI